MNNRLTRQSGSGFDPQATNQVYFYQAMTGWLTRRKMDFADVDSLHGDIDVDYSFSESGRLKTAAGVTYTFNGGGSLTKVAGSSSTDALTYSLRQRVTAMKTDGNTVATYQWNATNGRRTSEKDAGGAVTRSYTYGDDGMLSELEQGSTTLHFTYGADGQRLQTVRDGDASDTTTTYTYDGLSLLALRGVRGAEKWSLCYLYNASGVPYAGYYEDLGDDGQTPRSAWFGIVTDVRGDVLELLDRSGSRFASYRYSVWGQPQGGTNGVSSRATSALGGDADLASDIAARQVLRYCGYAYDSVSGLYYCSSRYYDPETRQWTSRDPAMADGAESAYQYASGNPTLAKDPSGERPEVGPGYYARYNPKTKTWSAVPYAAPSPWQIAVALYYRMVTPSPAATAAVHGGDVKAFMPGRGPVAGPTRPRDLYPSADWTDGAKGLANCGAGVLNFGLGAGWQSATQFSGPAGWLASVFIAPPRVPAPYDGPGLGASYWIGNYVVGPAGAGLAGGAAADGTPVAERLFTSRTVGVDSRLLGHSYARGEAGLLNRPGSPLKFGWSSSGELGGGWNLRLGVGRNPLSPNQAGFHRSFTSTHVPNAAANDLLDVIRELNGLR